MTAQIVQCDGRGKVSVNIIGEAGVWVFVLFYICNFLVGVAQKTGDLHKKRGDDQVIGLSSKSFFKINEQLTQSVKL